MNDKEREVMQQALEALETKGEHHSRVYEAITALREALAEQAEQDRMPITEPVVPWISHKVVEQEPVAWMNDTTPMGVFARNKEGAENFGCTIPLYTAPVQQAEQEPLVFRTDGVCRMKQFAGGAVEYYNENGNVTARFDGSLKVELEPIAKVCHDLPSHIGWNPNAAVNEFPEGMPLYAAPVSIHSESETDSSSSSMRTAVQQAEQEPVAWGVDWGKDGDQSCVSIIKKHSDGTCEVVAVEYSPNSVRTKNLTDDEIRAKFNGYVAPETLLMFRAVIAADRSKNGIV